MEQAADEFAVTSDPAMTHLGQWQSGYGVSSGTNSSDDYNLSEYVYMYDYSNSVDTLPLGELVPVGIIYGLTFLLGITGNILVILTTCRHRRLRSPTNIFLVSLASADLLLVVVCIPIKVST